MGDLQAYLSNLRDTPEVNVTAVWFPLMFSALGAVGVVLELWDRGDRALDKLINVPLNEEPYEFIVVGAGSAGSVLANRLSRHHSVLLLEAGGEPNPLQFIPAFALFFISAPFVDWQHKTVPQKYGSLMSINQISSWPSGKGLGGSGNLNLMIHLRGHTKDFDNWAKITGDPSWSWENVLPYFKSYEDYDDGGDSRYHGFGGSLRVGEPEYMDIATEFVKAGGEFGYPPVDLNGPYSEGFDITKHPIKHGFRQAPYKGFLQPIRTRKNLTIRKFSHVTRILFKEGNVAYGVEYDRHGESRTALANKEVIISAGAVMSPKILMLSGIGPEDHLKEIGIPVRQNLPVGREMDDHLCVYLGPFLIEKQGTVVLLRDYTPAAYFKYFSEGKDVISVSGPRATGMLSSSYAKARGEADWPDTLLMLVALSPFPGFGARLAQSFGFDKDEQEKYYETSIGKEGFVVGVLGSRPYSKGYLKLGGKDPYDKLIIDPNYLNDPGNIDIKSLAEGLKTTVRIVENSTALGVNYKAKFTTAVLPGCEKMPFRSDEYWECYARRYSVTLHHHVGSTGMGRVVDSQLRVMGTKNLRVIDAGIQPVIVATNTQASTLMIAEKGAAMILKQWGETAPAEVKACYPPTIQKLVETSMKPPPPPSYPLSSPPSPPSPPPFPLPPPSPPKPEDIFGKFIKPTDKDKIEAEIKKQDAVFKAGLAKLIQVPGPFFINKPGAVVLLRDHTPAAYFKYLSEGKDVLSITGPRGAGLISSSYAKARGEADWPDLLIMLYVLSPFPGFGARLAQSFGLGKDEQEKYYESAIGKEGFVIRVLGARPYSKGYLKLGGKDPYDKLIIDPNYLNDPGNIDIKCLVEGLKTTVRIVENSTALGVNYKAKFTTAVLPGCEKMQFRSDEYWECYARRYSVTLHHHVGSTGMGRVVDSQLRVLGTKNLRVIDAGIQPVIVTTNTQASTLMIAEKGAAMILKQWGPIKITNSTTPTESHVCQTPY